MPIVARMLEMREINQAFGTTYRPEDLASMEDRDVRVLIEAARTLNKASNTDGGDGGDGGNGGNGGDDDGE